MNTDDLREQFFKEHPNSKMDKCIMPEDVGYDYFTDDYVLWLEEKLILYNVVVPEGTLCDLDGKQVMVRFKVTKHIPKIVIDDI
jgi:hypothetical protein